MPDQEKEKIKEVVKEVLRERQQGNNGDDLEAREMQCAVDCTNAHNVALQTLQYCLAQGGKFSDPQHFNTIEDCAEFCELTASFLLRESERKKDVVRICARICEKCVEYCKQYSEDKHMAACAQYAETTKKSCEQLY